MVGTRDNLFELRVTRGRGFKTLLSACTLVKNVALADSDFSRLRAKINIIENFIKEGWCCVVVVECLDLEENVRIG